MASRTSPKGYTGTQIFLHWAIAALVIFQLIFGEDIGAAWRAYRRGLEPSADATFAANIHVYIGITVLVLALWRLALRVKNGAPPPPPGDSTIQKWIAGAAHIILYLAIIIMPISGSVAWFVGAEAAGEAHEIGKPVIIIVVALHALGALYQHFVAKSDVLMRMLKPARS
ncbi:MAG: cytochrome b [Hyphomicrobiales bacterium]|nr:cytochrome b [Hyphomicrobiales bacterium]